jgi:glycosyltransferase involved in cell wall biosynthesis
MRILHILYYGALGGIENYTRDLFSGLEARGHENVLVYDGERLPLLGRERRLHRIPGLSRPGRSGGSRLVRAITQVLEQDACEVAFVHTTLHPALAERLRTRLPTVYFAHTYGAFCPSGALLYERSDSPCPLRGVPNWRCLVKAYSERCNTRHPVRLWRTYGRAVEANRWLRRIDALVCDSNYVLRRHVENGFPQERGHVLPGPVPIPPAPVFSATLREPLVLFVGRVTPQKGLDYLLRAVSAIQMPHTLVVAGDGYELPGMRRLAERLGVSHGVTFRGALERSEVHALYGRAAVLAVPSVWPEPHGMVGPEAMSFGVPVVAFRVGGIPEWLCDGRTGFLVEPRDVRGLAGRIQQLLSDPLLARRLGACGRSVAQERFTFSRHIEGLERVLWDAIERRRGALDPGAGRPSMPIGVPPR